MQHISFNSKGLHTFDLSRKKSNCLDYCAVKSVCYQNQNIQDKLNPGYIKKMASNWRLINGKKSKFLKVMKNSIYRNNLSRIRWFSNGDLYFGDIEKSTKQLDNIISLVKIMPDNRFWLVTRNYDTLFNYFEILGNKKPENINIMLSIDFNFEPFVKNFCLKFKIQTAYIVEKKKDSNCKSSINGKSCIDNSCTLCFNYTEDPRRFKIHGSGNNVRFRKLMKK